MKKSYFSHNGIPFICVLYSREEIEEDVEEYCKELKNILIPYEVIKKEVKFEVVDLLSAYKERSNLIL